MDGTDQNGSLIAAEKKRKIDTLNGKFYIDPAILNPLPKEEFPKHSRDPETAFIAIEEELLLDGNAKQNLATFCQTWENEYTKKIMELGMDKNLIDKDEYPQTADVERRCVNLLANLWNAPVQGKDGIGCSTIGSSEAAMLGGMAAKWRWRNKRKAAGLSCDKPNMVCGSVQICWKKFAVYWDVEMREIEMSEGKLCIQPEDILKQCDENTIMVVPTLGVTYHGLYEDVEAISKALDEYQQSTGLDIPIHVDGASGGFIVPFTHEKYIWDFRLPRVKSINASGHKYGLSPLGCGWVLWRDAEYLPEELVFHVSYLGGDMPTFQINFSRPASQVIAQYFNFVTLGKEGYTSIHDVCHKIAQYFAQELEKLDLFEIIHDGDPCKGIPCVVWKNKEGASFTLYDVADRLRMRGWQVPAYPFTGTYGDVAFQRILVKRGFTIELAQLLIEDIKNAISHFDKNPLQIDVPASERGLKSGYSHL